MKILVCGSRMPLSFQDRYRKIVRQVLYETKEFSALSTEMIEGCCKNSADEYAEEWANDDCVTIRHFPAKWKEEGKSAGFKRNIEMVKVADKLIAFWDGKSKGTLHTIEKEREKGIDIKIIDILKFTTL